MEVLHSFQGIPTAVLADSQTMGGVMDCGIRPLSQDMVLLGRALTCQCVPGDNLALHKAITQAQPGDVLVVSCGGRMDCSVLGEMMAICCQGNDVAGVVIDGCVRDSLALVKMNFPTFCRGIHPKGPKREAMGTIGGAVVCGGVTVETGDIIAADADGVVVIKPQEAAAVLEKANAKLQKEAELLPLLRSGHTTWELFGLKD